MNFQNHSKKRNRSFLFRFFFFGLGSIAILWPLSLTTLAIAADITLAWDANTGPVDGYRAYCREQSEEYNYSQPAWEGSSTTCTIYGLDDNTTYCFVVRAFNEFGESGDSNEAVYSPSSSTISLDRSSLLNSCTEGSNASSQNFEIWNSGGGTLTYSISDDAEWLSCTPNSGTSTGEHDNITVDYSTSSLPPGNYSAVITISAEGAANSPQEIEVSLGISESNLPPSRPVITSPYPGEGECELLLPISTEHFSDPDGDYHSKSRWQVSTENNFSNPSLLVFDLTTSEHLTVLYMPHNVLNPAHTYYVRVQFYDSYNEASEWSDIVDFTTAVCHNDTNGDGIPDDQAVDATVDLNQDGVPDNDQPDVIKSVRSIDGTFSVGVCKISASISAIETVEMIDPSTISDNTNRPDALPFGVITYRLRVNQPGVTVTVKIYFSENISNAQTYFKYDTINGWQDYWEYTSFDDDGRCITLELKDGDHGDSDGLANSIIVDTGGLSEDISEGSTGGSSGGSCFIGTAASGLAMNNQSCAHRAFMVTILSLLSFLFVFFVLLLRKKQRRNRR
jgi:hypothetical protein